MPFFPVLLLLSSIVSPSAPEDDIALIETPFGNIAVEFFPDKAPNHVKNFITLAREKFYDGTTFHRVIPGFMIQGGDPATKDGDRKNDGMGLPGQKTIAAEFNDVKHLRGTLSMARKKNKDSASSQFFIMVVDKPHLDGEYTAFGKVLRGMETVDSIVAQSADKQNNPLERIGIKVRIVPRSRLSQEFR